MKNKPKSSEGKGIKEKLATTADLKHAIEIMEGEKLHLDAEIIVFIKGREYEVTSIGHFHCIPNLTLQVRAKK